MAGNISSLHSVRRRESKIESIVEVCSDPGIAEGQSLGLPGSPSPTILEGLEIWGASTNQTILGLRSECVLNQGDLPHDHEREIGLAVNRAYGKGRRCK